MKYQNIHFRIVDLKELSIGTPYEDFIEDKLLIKNDVTLERYIELTTFLVLYRYGGTFIESDYFLLKNIDNLPRNYLLIETQSDISQAIIDLESRENGQNFTASYLK